MRLMWTHRVLIDLASAKRVYIRDDNRGRLRVRLLGIDTPETNESGITVACWGPEATELAKATMLRQAGCTGD